VHGLLRAPRRQYSRHPLPAVRLSLETLEPRTLPANNSLTAGLAPILETEPNDTIDQAQSLGNLNTQGQVTVDGTIGRGTSGAADIDWYRFTLQNASAVSLLTRAAQPQRPFASILSLYGSTEPANGLAGQAPYRLLAQDDGADHGGTAQLNRQVAPGTYFVAVSSSGNQYFHPLIAGSGYPGKMGAYELLLQASGLGLSPSNGPVVLATEPAAGADVDRSPFVVRIDFSTALAARSIHLGSNVQLRLMAGTQTGVNPQPVPLASTSFDPIADELDLVPAAPLGPGSYEIFLAGDASSDLDPLMDPLGKPLGQSGPHPIGRDFTSSFRISGIKGNRSPGARADDTPATAQNLGDLTNAGLIHVAGALGDDPTDPVPFDPSDVDLYHFDLRGPGRFAFSSEVFAGRIGSMLDPALSLFRQDAAHELVFVASNDNSFNPTVTHDGQSAPLFTDPVLNVGLTQGDYYLAVSASNNVPMPAFGRPPGIDGIFDPMVSHSGTVGATVGEYVLNLAAEAMNDSPHVNGVPMMDGLPLTQGDILTAPPTSLSVAFNKTVNLRELVRQTGLPILDAVYIQDGQGNKFFPHVVNYADAENRAEFVLHEALPNGAYQLHLSSALGLTDLAGNPLVGNDPGGDYVIRFTVNGPARGSNGNPRVWLDKGANTNPAHAQDLGVLFPTELLTGVAVERTAPLAAASDPADYYQFRILQHALYSFDLESAPAISGIRLSLSDVSGKVISLVLGDSEGSISTVLDLNPGTYVLGVRGWPADVAANLTYRLNIVSFGQDQEPVVPLSIGPGPAVRIRPLTEESPTLIESPVPTVQITAVETVPSRGRDLGRIPSSFFLVLAAGPVGGPSGPAPSPRPSGAYESILAQSSETLLPEVVARLPLLIPAPHSGTEQSPAEAGQLLQWLQTVLHQFERLNWSQTLDVFYGSRQGQEKMRIRPVNVRPEEMPDKPRPIEGDKQPMSTAEDDQESEEGFWETMAPACAVAAAFAVRTPRARGRRRGGR